jgi:hypothetical protein
MTSPNLTRDAALALDAADPLRGLREQFSLPPGQIYLDGNSLGVLPVRTAERVLQVVQHEWGQGLIGSWNSAGWMDLAPRVGNKIARLVGAGPDELVCADSTSVNLFKVLSAALTITHADAPQRRVILSERSNFPTDLYIAEALARERGFTLQLAEADELPGLLDANTAVLMLTHVNYRTGRMHDMAALSTAAHAAGALVVWDLAHSGGAVPVSLFGRRHGQRRGLRRGLRLQVPERRPGRPGLRVGPSRAIPRAWTRKAGGSRSPAGSGTRRPSPSRPTTSRVPASPGSSAARRRCCRSPRSSAAWTRCSPPVTAAAWRRCGRSRSRSRISSSHSSRRAAAATTSRRSLPRITRGAAVRPASRIPRAATR